MEDGAIHQHYTGAARIIREQPELRISDGVACDAVDALNRLATSMACGDLRLPVEYQIGAKIIKSLKSGNNDPKHLAAEILVSDTLTAACLRAAVTVTPRFAKTPPKDLHHAVVCIGAQGIEILILRALALSMRTDGSSYVARICAQWKNTTKRLRSIIEDSIRAGVVLDDGDWLTPLLLHRIGSVVLGLDDELGVNNGRVSELLLNHGMVISASRAVIRFYLGAHHVDSVLSPVAGLSRFGEVSAKELGRAAVYFWNDSVACVLRDQIVQKGGDAAGKAMDELVLTAREGYSFCPM